MQYIQLMLCPKCPKATSCSPSVTNSIRMDENDNTGYNFGTNPKQTHDLVVYVWYISTRTLINSITFLYSVSFAAVQWRPPFSNEQEPLTRDLSHGSVKRDPRKYDV